MTRPRAFFRIRPVISLLLVVPVWMAWPGVASEPDSPAAAAAAIAFDLPQEGRVSLAIYDHLGTQVRTLLSAEPMDRGHHQVHWDGLDREGKSVPPANYRWKLLLSQGLRAEYLLSLGTSVGTHHWPAQHGGPNTVAVEDDAVIVGGTPEGSPLMAKLRFDGTWLWARPQLRAPEGTQDTSSDGGRLYALQNSSILYVLDGRDGSQVQRKDGKGAISYRLGMPIRRLDAVAPNADQGDPARTLEIPVANGNYLVRIKARLGEKAISSPSCKVQGQGFGFEGLKSGGTAETIGPSAYGTPQPAEVRDGKLRIEFAWNDKTPGATWAMEEIELLAPAERVDARDGAVVVAFPSAGAIAWIDPVTGGMLKTVPVPGVEDVTLLEPTVALAAAGNRVVRVKQEDASVMPVVQGLDSAKRLATDRKTRTIFVVLGGKQQQVLAFDRNFRKTGAFGRKGGRLAGLYHAEDFLEVADIAADGHGGFVVVEALSAPRRTAHFDAQGKLLGEWYGGQQFYTYAQAEPDEPNLVWMDSQWGWLMQVEVDWARRTWKPRATYRWDEELHPLLMSNYKMTRGIHPFRCDLRGDGHKDLCLWSDAHAGLIFRVDEAAGKLRTLAMLGRVDLGPYKKWHPYEQLPQGWLDAIARLGKNPHEFNDRRMYTGFAWADANGDGRTDADEFTLIPPEVYKNGHGFQGSSSSCLLLDEKRNIYQGRGYGGEGQPAWTIYPAGSSTKCGAPRWDWAKSTDGTKTAFPETPSLCPDGVGGMITLSRGGGDGYVAQGTYANGHAFGWPGNQTDASAICRWDRAGRKLWQVGAHAAQLPDRPGRLHYPTLLAGIVNGCVAVCDKVVQPCEFWTEDGLYVGGLFDRRVEDGLPKRIYSWWRADRSRGDEFSNLALLQYDMIVGGSLVKLPGGDVIFLGAGWNNVPAFRITGWNELSRQEGEIKIVGTSPRAVQQGTGLRAEFSGPAPQPQEGKQAVDKLADGRIWFEPSRKGHEWPVRGVVTARWTGMLEPRFSEPYTLAIYAVGKARVWLGGRLILDNGKLGRDDSARVAAAEGRFWKEFSRPIPLEAGGKVALRVEWEGNADRSEIHLNWESPSQAIQHVPASALYPESPPGDTPVVGVHSNPTKALRPGTGDSTPAAILLKRNGGLQPPLWVGLEWSGSAKAGVDYRPLPSSLVFQPGQGEIRLAIEALPAPRVTPTVEVIAALKPAGNFLIDGQHSGAAVALTDSRAKRITGVTVRATSSPIGKNSMNLHKEGLQRLVDGSGLDRSKDPPGHSHDIATQWFAEWADADRTALVFDLGAAYDLAECRIWNANTKSAHGQGWGDGPSVRHGVKQVCLAVGEAPEGPWKEAGRFSLQRASGEVGEPGELLPLGIRCRYVRMQLGGPIEMHCLGLSEVEFFGTRIP